jgi:serine/threonine-protein kinase
MAETEPDPNHPLRVVGRYALYGQLAAGGMATVHFGRLLGPVGFSRTVAIKRLHPQFAKDPEFVAMFLDEARLAARIQHPNVVATVDVVAMEEELFLVMDYIRGESLSRLLRAAKRQNIELPEGFVTNVVAGLLHGLHAAHEATDERGRPLHVVHRDVSPQNVLVGVDGVARVLDFGVAKAAARIQVTRDGQMKGKLSYMSPEQLSGASVDRRCDVFAAGVVLWETLTRERLFTGEDVSDVLTKILRDPVPPPSTVNPRVRGALDQVVMRALDKNPETRFQTARDFAVALEEATEMMSPRSVGEWVERIAGDSLERRERALAEIESVSSVNEMQLTPSDPGFMRTLKTQVRGAALPLRPTLSRPPPLARQSGPGAPPKPSAPPKPFAPTKPSVPPRLVDADEVATTIYHGPPNAQAPVEHPNERPPPLPQDAFAELPPAVIVAEPGPLLDDTGVTGSPFRSAQPWRPYAIWAGGGMLAVGALYFLLSALLAVNGNSTPAPAATVVVERPPVVDKVDKKVEKQPPEEEQAKAEPLVDPEELPIADEEVATSTEPKVARKKKAATSGHASGSSGSSTKQSHGSGQSRKSKRGDCSQPWYVDGQGIRRIKAECL